MFSLGESTRSATSSGFRQVGHHRRAGVHGGRDDHRGDDADAGDDEGRELGTWMDGYNMYI